jgi:hypothetical protein
MGDHSRSSGCTAVGVGEKCAKSHWSSIADDVKRNMTHGVASQWWHPLCTHTATHGPGAFGAAVLIRLLH